MGVLIERYREELRRSARPALERATLAGARIGFDQMLASSYPACNVAPIVDREIGSHGRTVRLRTYSLNSAPGPAILFFHGGGFVLGSIESHDGFCRALATVTRIPVVSVGYALAPEHPYPAAVEDARAAVQWMITNGNSLNVDPRQIVVMGDSAGAYLATRVADAFAEVALQVLLYPAVDFTTATASHAAFGSGYGLDREAISFCYGCFLGDAARTVPEVSPVLATRRSNAAPAIVVVAESDPLRDEGIAYATLLNRNGRGAALWDIPDTVHGFAAYPSVFPQARTVLERLADRLLGVFPGRAIDDAPIRTGG